MLMTLGAVAVGPAALALALLWGALVSPVPNGQARNPQGSQYLLR